MENRRPWEKLRELIKTNDVAHVKAYLDGLKAEEIVISMSHIGHDNQLRLLTLLAPEDAAVVMEDIPEVQAVDLL